MIKLLRNLKPFKWAISAIMILMLIRTFSELMLPRFMANIVNIGVINGDTNYIWRTGALMLGVALFGGITSIISSYLSAKVGVGFARDLREKVFTKVTSFSLHEIDEVGTSSLITRSTNDITQIQNVVVMMMRIAIRAPLMAVGSIIMALQTDLALSGVIFVVVLLMAMVIAVVASKALPLFKIIQKKVDQLNLVMRERLTGMRVIRAFNKVERESDRFEVANSELTDISIKVNKLMAVMMPLMMLIFNLTTVTIVWYGSQRIDAGFIEIGSMMAFLQYAMMLLFAVMMLTMVFIMIPRASASAVRINEVLNLESEISSPDKAVTTVDGGGQITFDHVTFSYHSEHGAEEAALQNISFESGPGEVTAIIGGTGSGKSTLINLVPRFYDVTSGEIRINGVNIKEMSLKDLRNKIGLVPQTTLLFNGSVSENIRYGHEEATDEAVKKAVSIAQGLEFVEAMEDGFDSVIAQGGSNISGGQKQRLSIARALVKAPEIYLFDDSFSALDYKTESMLRESLKQETNKATVIIVAQKVTSVMDADRIIVLEDGKAVGIGTHKTLLESNSVYKEIVMSQLSEEEIA